MHTLSESLLARDGAMTKVSVTLAAGRGPASCHGGRQSQLCTIMLLAQSSALQSNKWVIPPAAMQRGRRRRTKNEPRPRRRDLGVYTSLMVGQTKVGVIGCDILEVNSFSCTSQGLFGRSLCLHLLLTFGNLRIPWAVIRTADRHDNPCLLIRAFQTV